MAGHSTDVLGILLKQVVPTCIGSGHFAFTQHREVISPSALAFSFLSASQTLGCASGRWETHPRESQKGQGSPVPGALALRGWGDTTGSAASALSRRSYTRFIAPGGSAFKGLGH